jgi:hypothetical protein
MKKLFVLVAALLLVSMVAAAEVTVSGKVEIRELTDFNDETFANDGIVELKFDATVDENNSVYIEIEEEGTPDFGKVTEGITVLLFDRAHFTSNIGAMLGLPVGVEIKAGFNEWKGSDAMGVSKGDYEDFYGDDFKAWGYQVEVMAADFVTLRTTFGGDWDGEEWLIGAYGTYDPITYEVFYIVDTDYDVADGEIQGGGEYHGDVADGIALGASVAGKYELDSEIWALGVGVDVLYNDTLRAGVGYRTEKDKETGAMQVDLSAVPPAPVDLEVFLAVGLALDEGYQTDDETFDSLDFGVKLDVGAEFYVGYLYSKAGGNIGKEWAEISPTGEEGAVYLRGVLSF